MSTEKCMISYTYPFKYGHILTFTGSLAWFSAPRTETSRVVFVFVFVFVGFSLVGGGRLTYSLNLHSFTWVFNRWLLQCSWLVNESQRTEFYAYLDCVGNQCQMQNADKIMLSSQFTVEFLSIFWHGKFNAENWAVPLFTSMKHRLSMPAK